MDDKSQLAKSAEEYIKYETGQDVSDQGIKLDEDGKICVDKVRKIRIDHKGAASEIVKIAHLVKMSGMARKVISIRVINPGITTMGISLATGIDERSVKAYEREGLNRIKQYLVDSLRYKDAAEKAAKDQVVSQAIAGELNLQGKKNSLLK